MLRTFLILARASNLPTVWSNCLAGWLLGGGGDALTFFALCTGATLLYVGGMFLNDAFDAEFDRKFRQERPIPSGKISEGRVWLWAYIFLAAGLGSMWWLGKLPIVLGLLLIVCIIFYNALHKHTIFSPVLMAGCRFFLYLLAASASNHGLSGLLVWSASVLALYIMGLSYIAKNESEPGPLRYWPCVLLVSPIVLAVLVNDHEFQKCSYIFSAALVIWTLWSVHFIFRRTKKNISAGVSSLLAGIVFVDLLAIGPADPKSALWFGLLFLAARFFQKFIPAT